MKYLLFLAFLPLSLSAQECWQCLSYAERDQPAELLSTCQAVANRAKSQQDRSVAQLILARQHMNDAAYDKALPLLDSIRKSGIPLLSWMATGLKGDCLLDQGKLTEAAALYQETANTCENDYFAPYYLFKAGKVLAAQKKPTEAYTVFKTIQNRYLIFGQQQSMGLYIDPALDAALKLNEPRVPQKMPASPMGPGSVLDEKVDPAALKIATDYIFNQEITSREQQGIPVDDQALQQINDRAWQYYVEMTIIRKMLSQVGMAVVTPDDLYSYLFGQSGYQLMPEVAENFTDVNTGELDKDMLQGYIDEMSTVNKDQWQALEKAVMEQMLYEKYHKLLGQALFVTRWEAEYEDFRKNTIIQASVAFKSLREVDEITVSEKELQEYYQQHIVENRYNKPAGKELRMARILVVPDQKDTAAFLAEMEALKKQWKKGVNDSLFVLEHSNVPFYVPNHQSTILPESDPEAQPGMILYPESMKAAFAKAKRGDLVGPYLYGDNFYIAKVIGHNENLISARHILLMPDNASEEGRAQNKQLAMQLLKEVNHENFESYVMEYSDDRGSVNNGGVYTDFLDFEMVQPFADYCANTPIGKIGLVETDFGYHIVEVIERKKVHYPVCVFIRKEMPDIDSGQRAQKIAEGLMQTHYSLAAGLPDPNAKVLLFDSLVRAAGYFPIPFRVPDNAPVINGLSESSTAPALELMYGKDAAVGSTFISNNGYEAVISIFAASCDGAQIPYISVRDEMKRRLEGERKAEILLQQAAGIPSVKAIAEKWNVSLNDREMVLENPSFLPAGYQPEVIGTVFRDGEPGQLFVLPCNGGVCAIRINEKSYPPKRSDYEEARRELQEYMFSMLQTNIRSSYDNRVIDNRRLDALGLR